MRFTRAMTQNPYAPPQADQPFQPLTGDEETYQPLATTGQRFANFIVDSIVRTILTYAVTALVVMAGAQELVLLFTLPLFFFYYFIFELVFGWTPGKLVTGTRVVSRDGSKLTAWRVAGRTLSRVVPFEPFSFINGPPGWHDSWSNTLVVQRAVQL